MSNDRREIFKRLILDTDYTSSVIDTAITEIIRLRAQVQQLNDRAIEDAHAADIACHELLLEKDETMQQQAEALRQAFNSSPFTSHAAILLERINDAKA